MNSSVASGSSAHIGASIMHLRSFYKYISTFSFKNNFLKFEYLFFFFAFILLNLIVNFLFDCWNTYLIFGACIVLVTRIPLIAIGCYILVFIIC